MNAHDLIDQLDDTGRSFLLGWIASQLDDGRPFTIDSLRECLKNERLTRPTYYSSVP